MEAHPITDYLYRWVPALAYLAWFIVGTVSMYRTNVIVAIAGVLFWLSGSFMICDIMVRIAGIAYIPFAPTIPFCLLFGIPAWTAILCGIICRLWQALHYKQKISPPRGRKGRSPATRRKY